MDVGRVVLVCPDLEQTGPTFNALSLSRAFRIQEIAPLVIAGAGGERENAFGASGVEVCIEAHVCGWLRGRETRRYIQRFKPDLVHAQCVSVLPEARRLARLCRVPLLVTVNRTLAPKELSMIRRTKGCTFVAVSTAIFTHLVQVGGVPRGEVTVIHNGVDLSRYTLDGDGASARRSTVVMGERRHVSVVGTLGSLRPRKGQETFLRAAALLLQGRSDVEFLVVGRGPVLATLKALAVELGVAKRVTFTTGSTFATASGDRLSSKLEAVFLREFDIFVEPSRDEGLGLSAMQAMAWGRPVVACGVGGLYSLVEDGVTGILVPKEDPAEMAKAVCDLLDSPARAEEMGRRGRERIAAEFNIKAISRQHAELYARLCGGVDETGS